MYLDEIIELICDPNIREDRRDRLAAQYAAEWAARELQLEGDPELAELLLDIGDLIALAMRKQHERTMQLQFEVAK